ncbi:PORR domain-containing protein [Citrus sinensis]|uniref:PORR domain-containing protein n=1 Tax=Citrus sinensis TaxID=2711 RepID=A0ACB8KU54_CITSI|nr:PORR domain-containing protein [Citrus sinensis]
MNKLLKRPAEILRCTVTEPAVKLSDVKWIRDRGLDHAVAREKNLKPLLNIKNLIKSEPSKSLPITIITQQKDSLQIPIRPMEFIRRYPSVFQEFLPGNVGVQPHIKLTPEVLDIDADEQLVYQSQSYRQVVAGRLLKLLMISQMNKITLTMIDLLKWDLGLPDDFLTSLVPDFPDYFRAVGYQNKHERCSGFDLFGELELVCWSNDFAVSVVEKKAKAKGIDGENIMFSMNFSSGFEIDKKMKKWMDNWQKLPYISPYENATHLLPKSDESDKWAVAIMHEVISLFGAQKVEREKLLCFGNYLGIRSWFKRALLNHPGIFYVSNKSGMYTVVLKEAYKRGSLIESDPLMNVRSRYIHLMNMVKEEKKVIAMPGESKGPQQRMPLEEEKEEKQTEDAADDDSEGENDVASYDDDDSENYEEEEEERRHRKGLSRSYGTRRGRTTQKMNFDDDSEDYDGEEEESKHNRVASRIIGTRGGRTTRKMNWDVEEDSGNFGRGNSIRNLRGETRGKLPSRYTGRREMQGENNGRWNSGEWKYYGRREMQGKNNGRWNSGEGNNSRQREMPGKNSGCRNSGEQKYTGRREMQGDNNGRRNSGERKYTCRREMQGENNGRRNSGERKYTGRREMQGENSRHWNSGERVNYKTQRSLST